MKPYTKSTILLMLLATLAMNIRAADIPAFEFYLGSPDKKESPSLVFDVTETSTGHRNSHTLYMIKATVVESGLDALKPGTEFEGYFDRVYAFLSYTSMPETHPFKIGDRIEIGGATAGADSISGFIKKKEFHEPPKPAWNDTDAITVGRMTMTPRSDFIRKLHQRYPEEKGEEIHWQTKDDRYLSLLYFTESTERCRGYISDDYRSKKNEGTMEVDGVTIKLLETEGFFGYGMKQFAAHIQIGDSFYIIHSANLEEDEFMSILDRLKFNKKEPDQPPPPITTPRIDNDHSMISVEAVVSPKVYSDFVVTSPEVYSARVEVKSPTPKFDRFLEIHSTKPLPADHPLRQNGATLTFTTEKRYLVNILSDPAEKHDFTTLYTDAVSNLKNKEAYQQSTAAQVADIVLPYGVFGPPSAVYELIGWNWWQWNQWNPDDPSREYPIKVVVYWNQTLEQIKKKYPVDEAKEQDYRYVEYTAVVPYLEKTIKEIKDVGELDFLASALERTLTQIQAAKQKEAESKRQPANTTRGNAVPANQTSAEQNRSHFIGQYFSPGSLESAHKNFDINLKEDGTYSLLLSFPERDGVEMPDGSIVFDKFEYIGQWSFDGAFVILKPTEGEIIKLTPWYADGRITLSDGMPFGIHVRKARLVGADTYD